MQYACDFAYCSRSRAVIRYDTLIGTGRCTTYYLVVQKNALLTRRDIQHPSTRQRGTSQHKSQKHHPRTPISRTNHIWISSNATPMSFLPTRSPNMPHDSHSPNPPPRPSSSTQAFPFLPSSRASMALPLIMLTKNTNARGKKLSCLFSSASSRLIDLVTGENKEKGNFPGIL